jgi:drug/metabolite transporter (DMT)-like permease
MILAGLRAGERPCAPEWLGLLLAVGGLAYLVLPGLSAPSPVGAALMAVAGAAWGGYSLQGRGSGDPVAVTTLNFARATPLAAAASLALLPQAVVSPRGLLLAILSGALASGGGYVLWYGVVRRMPATLAATVQLTVPVLAAAGGVVFLAERVTLRLSLAALAILGGVAIAVLGRTSLFLTASSK